MNSDHLSKLQARFGKWSSSTSPEIRFASIPTKEERQNYSNYIKGTHYKLGSGTQTFDWEAQGMNVYFSSPWEKAKNRSNYKGIKARIIVFRHFFKQNTENSFHDGVFKRHPLKRAPNSFHEDTKLFWVE